MAFRHRDQPARALGLPAPRTRGPRVVASVAGAVVIAVALTACSGTSTASDSASSVPAESEVAKIAALLPESITSSGVLRIAVPDGSAPLSSVDASGEPVGQDPDFAKAIGEVLGVEVELTAGSYDEQIPSLQAGREDMAMGGYYITPTRLANADFVSYWSDTSSFATRSDSSWKPKTAKALCGHPIAVLKGSAEEASISAYDDENCSSHMKISSFKDQASSFLALSSGRIDAVVTGREILETAAKKSTAFKISGAFGGGPVAVAVARNDDSTQLLAALQAAFDRLIEDGTYEAVLKKWRTSYGAVESAKTYTEDSTPPDYS